MILVMNLFHFFNIGKLLFISTNNNLHAVYNNNTKAFISNFDIYDIYIIIHLVLKKHAVYI